MENALMTFRGRVVDINFPRKSCPVIRQGGVFLHQGVQTPGVTENQRMIA